MNDDKYDWLYTFIGGIITTIVGIPMSGIIFWIFIKSADTFSRIVVIPFLICFISVPIFGIVEIVKGISEKRGMTSKKEKKLIKLESIPNNLYKSGFLVFWFGFLIVFDWAAIQSWSNGGIQMFIFSIIFWVAGIFAMFK